MIVLAYMSANAHVFDAMCEGIRNACSYAALMDSSAVPGRTCSAVPHLKAPHTLL